MSRRNYLIDASLMFRIELIKSQSILERSLSDLLYFLLEVLDFVLIIATAIVDQVSGCGRLSEVDVTDVNQIYLIVFFHFGVFFFFLKLSNDLIG